MQHVLIKTFPFRDDLLNIQVCWLYFVVRNPALLFPFVTLADQNGFSIFFQVAMWSVIESTICILHDHTWHWGISGYGLEITVKIFYELKREKKENWHKIILHRSIHVFEHTIFPLKFLFSVVFISALPSNVTQEPVSGSDLYCYECKEIYKKGYDPLNSPCRNNVTAVGVRQCLPEHRYCVVSNPSDCFISVRSKT